MRDVCRWFLGLVAVPIVLLGCEQGQEEGIIEEEGTEVQWPYEGREAGTYVCTPLIDPDEQQVVTDDVAPSEQGTIAQLFYLPPELPHYTSVHDYIENGTRLDFDIFFSEVNVPTRPFDRGFETIDGRTIMTPEGDTLYEWFGLEFTGKLQLGPDQLSGDYQFSLLSDDGAVLEMDIDGDGEFETIIDNDGWTPTRMACNVNAIFFDESTEYSYRLRYFQGPRTHIAMVLMMRPLPEDPADDLDPQCGKSGNSRFFDSTQSPPEPRPAYLGLLDRGWAPLKPENFKLHAVEGENPCHAPAPTFTEGPFVTNIQRTEVDVNWNTDVFSISTIEVQEVLTGLVIEVPVIPPEFKLEHSTTVTGLKTNTLYNLRVISTSTSGLSTTSNPDVLFRTLR